MNAVRNLLAILSVVLSCVGLYSEPQGVPTRQVPHFSLDVDLVEVRVTDDLHVAGKQLSEVPLPPAMLVTTGNAGAIMLPWLQGRILVEAGTRAGMGMTAVLVGGPVALGEDRIVIVRALEHRKPEPKPLQPPKPVDSRRHSTCTWKHRSSHRHAWDSPCSSRASGRTRWACRGSRCRISASRARSWPAGQRR